MKKEKPVPLQEMTLRDFFAAFAMQAYSSSGEWTRSISQEETAQCAYKMADEMLKERLK